ncbi:MAG TPA: hypothetical protein VJS20_11575 [Gemmatimonadales bacterium]|nr:hypothetical protein [Gemmatimonadales bacterium]
MPEPKPEWLAALKAVDDKADLRFNYAVNRWEFILTCADGTPRSQFWCQYGATRRESYVDTRGVKHWQTVPDRDPVTGMLPYRELTDLSFREAMKNLERSFVGNPFDGAGTVRRQVMQAHRFNQQHKQAIFRKGGELLSDFIWEHRRQLRDGGAGPVSGWTPASEPQAPKLVVVSH